MTDAIGYAKFRSRSHDALIRFTMMLATRLKRTSTLRISSSHSTILLVRRVAALFVPDCFTD